MTVKTGSDLRAAREAIGLSQARFAELTGIPQHMLSAFELGKSPLTESALAAMAEALKDSDRVNSIKKRRKRYQTHVYAKVQHDATRASRHAQTTENQRYVAMLGETSSSRVSCGKSALSLFSGCGGMSLGFYWAGFKIKGFLELNAGLRSIYRSNFPDTIELGGDIAEMDQKSIEAGARHIGRIDVIIGGPPCQGFSLSGKRSISDPRNTLFRDYLRFVDVYRPKVVIMENVRLLTSMKSPHGGLVRDEIRCEFKSRGYNVEMYEVNAKDHGVPQHRERVFFVAVRRDVGKTPSFPRPTHGRETGLFDDTSLWRTFADACSDLKFLESGERSADPLHSAVSHPQHVIEWLWDVQEGFSAHENEDPSKRPPSGYNTTYKRQVWAEPGATVQTTFGMISGCRNVHPIATRSLTVREAARLQSFPDTFDFGTALGTARTGIGNAVPPLLAYNLGRHIASDLL